MNGVNAARIGRRLIELEYRGPGDMDGAMHRLEAKTGISYWTWRHWRNREPSEGVLQETWERLTAWYAIEVARQKRKFEEELAEAKALGRDENNTLAVRAAVALARKA